MSSTPGAGTRRTAFLLALGAGLWSLAAQVSAHRVDELLQATLVAIEPPRVELRVRLSPGTDLAGLFLRMVDTDGNGALSAGEARAYAEGVRRALAVELDGRALVLSIEAVEAADPEKLRSGTGAIFVELGAEMGHPMAGKHCLAFANRHLPELSAFLVNAVVPSNPEVRIERQDRDERQSRARIHFELARDTPGAGGVGNGSVTVLAAVIGVAAVMLAGAGWGWRKRVGQEPPWPPGPFNPSARGSYSRPGSSPGTSGGSPRPGRISRPG